MRVFVCLGTGGVGKTSIAAAAALRFARSGGKSLVLTIDPARRLRTALKLDGESFQQKVPLEDEGTSGEMWAALLDVKMTLDRVVESYASEKEAKTILNHGIYKMLVDSLAGMEELLAIERVDQAIQDGFDTIVIDTAPSRHALEFLDKPEFFAELVSFPLVRMMGRSFRLMERFPLWKLSRKTLELYTHVESMVGGALVRQVLDFYSVFRTVAEGYAERAKATISILRDPSRTRFFLVTLPSKALQDSGYFLDALQERKFPVHGIILNRRWPKFEFGLSEQASGKVVETVHWCEDVAASHAQVAKQLRSQFRDRLEEILEVEEIPGNVSGLQGLTKIADALELH
jgi:anion-transporting  ArsA/GET3 family ATPase